MAYETTKATRRRLREDDAGEIPWREILSGKILDIGCGPDPLRMGDVTTFDLSGADVNGDANYLSRYFAPESFDAVHGSQVLEHVYDPAAALHDWLKVLKPGGYCVMTVPSWELYEGMVWPSRTNPDHKSSWSIWQKGSPAPIHCKLPEWLHQFGCEVALWRIVDTNFDYSVGTTRDQTWRLEDGVECWIEFVIIKPNTEVCDGGRKTSEPKQNVNRHS